jgi:hypothetical protein
MIKSTLYVYARSSAADATRRRTPSAYGATIAVERLEVEAMTENKPRPTRAPQSGDLIEITGHRVGDPPRSGEILEILGDPGEPHFRVRWEDGHESIFYPGNDAVVRRLRTKA